MAKQDSDTWTQRLEEAGIPCAKVQNVAQAIEHPQTQAIDILQSVPDSAMTLLGLPARFDGVRPAIRRAPPKLNGDPHLLDKYRKTVTEAK